MHYAKSFVRPASLAALRAAESRATAAAPLVSVTLIDAYGGTEGVSLAHPRVVGDLIANAGSPTEALQVVRSVRERVKQLGALLLGSTAPSRNGDLTFYVKERCGDAANEVRCRQERLLARWEGRLIAGSFDAVSQVVSKLLERVGLGEVYTDEEIALYRGIVEELASKDAEAALAVALNSKLPPLSASANSALAKMVDVQARTAMSAFLDAFAVRDASVPSHETCATQLLIRLRQEHHKKSEGPGDGNDSTGDVGSRSDPAVALWEEVLSRGLRECQTDPGSVFPTDALRIQQWAAATIPRSSALLPLDKAATLKSLIISRRLLPRRTVMDTLSTWCLSDLERDWVRFAVFDVSGSPANVGGPPAQQSTATPCVSALHPVVEKTFRQQSLTLILKDARRYLVANRLLHEYASLLEKGYLGPSDPSFPSFLEECGECHDAAPPSNDVAPERPSLLSFTMPQPSAGMTVLEALENLAPQCAYWRTLLRSPSLPAGIEVTLAPMGDIRVRVPLPASDHECLAAVSHRGDSTTPCMQERTSAWAHSEPTVLYEDADIVVWDKPAGLATSRHALSATQRGTPATDLVSLHVARSLLGKRAPASVGGGEALGSRPGEMPFRHGQVHRLDQETSGCVVFAKTPRAMDSLRHQMGTGAAFGHEGKTYLALCLVMEPQLDRLPLRHDLADPSDSKIRTKYRVLRFFRRSRVALVECRIQQGKKHQIRRHLAAAGLPILGDLDHGGAACCSPLMNRVALHASTLSIVHPVTAETVSFTAPLPNDFRAALSQLSDG